MKVWHIILIFAVVIGSFFGFRDCVHSHYLNSEEVTFNPLSYIFARSEWSSFSEDDQIIIARYNVAAERLQLEQKKQAGLESFAKEWYERRDSVKAFVSKREILYVKRIAVSPDLVMMAPSFYRESYSGNEISAQGRGADRERLHLFYLSNGEIIKASARTNSEWLAVSVGQRIEKTEVLKLKKHSTFSLPGIEFDATIKDKWAAKSYLRHGFKGLPGAWYCSVPNMVYETEISYKPIFFN